jgi:hypothetical protein
MITVHHLHEGHLWALTGFDLTSTAVEKWAALTVSDWRQYLKESSRRLDLTEYALASCRPVAGHWCFSPQRTLGLSRLFKHALTHVRESGLPYGMPVTASQMGLAPLAVGATPHGACNVLMVIEVQLDQWRYHCRSRLGA